jgi:hypothetical protein
MPGHIFLVNKLRGGRGGGGLLKNTSLRFPTPHCVKHFIENVRAPNQNVRAPQRARGNVRAHRQNGPPCDPRASPDHPTW